ncbi:hypothetical protein RJG79_01900 [Mycoplasmatota bacterium WC44]
MKNKTTLTVLGIALFIYIFELRILDQLNITSDQFFIMNRFYNSTGGSVVVVDLTFIFIVILLLLNIFPTKMISKINSSIINLVLWVISLGVFMSETSLRPETVNGSIDVSTFDITYQQSSDVFYTSLNSLAYFLILIFIVNVFLMIRTKNKFTGVNIIILVLCWLEYMNELAKFPLTYNGTIKSNLFRTLFTDTNNITIIHFTIFLILLPILLNILVLVNRYLKKAEKKKEKKKETFPEVIPPEKMNTD